MPKDSLADAIFELKDKDRRGSKPKVTRQKPKPATHERPKAFDSFHVFSQTLLVMGLALQIVALLVYA